MTPDLIIGALVALAVLAVFAAIFFYRQSKAQGVASSDNQLFGEGLDEQIKEQFKTVLLGQSVIISKEQHNEFVAQSTQLQQYADSLTELKAQLQNLSAENTQLKQQNQEQGLQLSEAQSTNSHLKELNETQKQALEAAASESEYAALALRFFNSYNGVEGLNGVDKEPIELFKGIKGFMQARGGRVIPGRPVYIYGKKDRVRKPNREDGCNSRAVPLP